MIQVVGIGPGRREGRTIAADDALRRAEVIVGYTTYVELVRDEFAEKRFVTTGMHGEKERCVQALLLSREGRRVALICSGDAQVYGMASLLLGMAEEGDEIEVVPGVTAALSAAAVTVSIPGGEELAKRTFNPRLGVVGGLSVLGTTGVVRPMSEEALKETIRLELSVRKSQGAEEIGLVFGSQGERAANALFPCMQAVQMSNFVGFALDCAAELGFARATLLGQPGKLVKVSGGSMQTHSQYGDGRRETLIAHLALMGAPVELLEFVRQSVTLDGCISPIYDAGFDAVWTHLADAAAAYAAARIHGEMRVDAVMLDAKGQILGRSTSL